MFRLECAFIAEIFFYGGQSRVKSNTELNNSEGILKLFTILEMSFLKLPKASKYPRSVKFLEDFL